MLYRPIVMVHVSAGLHVICDLTIYRLLYQFQNVRQVGNRPIVFDNPVQRRGFK